MTTSNDDGTKAPPGFGKDVSEEKLMTILEVPDSDRRLVALYFSLPEDRFDFILEKKNPLPPNSTFSMDGVESFVQSVRQWMMSRVWKRWLDTDKPPQRLVMECTLRWED